MGLFLYHACRPAAVGESRAGTLDPTRSRTGPDGTGTLTVGIRCRLSPDAAEWKHGRNSQPAEGSQRRQTVRGQDSRRRKPSRPRPLEGQACAGRGACRKGAPRTRCASAGNGGRSMKSPVVKRSIVIAGHKTSVSREDAFWKGLKEIASGRNMTLSDLVASIDGGRRQGNLSSAIRLFVLDHYRMQAAGGDPREAGPMLTPPPHSPLRTE